MSRKRAIEEAIRRALPPGFNPSMADLATRIAAEEAYDAGRVAGLREAARMAAFYKRERNGRGPDQFATAEEFFAAARNEEEAIAIVQCGRGSESIAEAQKLARFLSSDAIHIKVFRCSISAEEVKP